MDNKKIFEAHGQGMDLITKSIQKREKETAERNDHDDAERISICCSAILNDFNICTDCKEPSSPVDENDEEYQAMREEYEMKNEESNRLESQKKYA